MPLNSNELIEAAEVVLQAEGAKNNLACSTKSAGFAAIMTFLGGLVGGPLGLLIGGSTGGICSYFYYKNKFMSGVEIIRQMSSHEKDRLAAHLQRAIEEVSPTDLVSLTVLLNSPDLTQMMLNVIMEFFKSDLQIKY